MAINATLADSFFGKHLSGGVWNRYTTSQKQQAIAHAIRFIDTLLEDDLDDDTTTDGDFPRMDCAVYEQALYTLQNTPDLPDAESPTPSELFPTKEGAENKTRINSIYKLCAAARFYISKNRITLSRG